MWPFRKKSGDAGGTSAAIAYLKVPAPDSDDTATVELSPADTPVIKDLGNGLLASYVVDRGNDFQYIQERELESDSVTKSELHEIGLQNLTNVAASGNLRVTPYGNIFAVFLDGNFEASLILLDSLWTDSFRQFVKGDYLAAFPARDILSFCDASSDVGRKELLELIDRLKDTADHPLSQQIYARCENNWQPERS